MNPGMLIDITKCIGCEACSRACKEANNLPPEMDPILTWKTWKVIVQQKGLFYAKACMHCDNPTCVSVCPVGAMKKTELGPVVYHPEICIGCRYCLQACPFRIPKYEWNNPTPVVGKCIMCYGRVSAGKPTACSSVCPTGATIFGNHDDLLREAKQRIGLNPNLYVDHIYGEKEAGGTSILYLAPLSFAELGFNTKGMEQVFPALTWKVQKEIPKVFSITGVMMMGLWWIINRREKYGDKTPDEIDEMQKHQ